jgi:predicted SnoaL-like aldol condensation-catalyzing enzyme
MPEATAEGIMSVWLYLFATHPDIRATVGDMLAEGDKVATRVVVERLSTGDGGALMFEIVRIREEQVVELWNAITWQ